MKIIGNTVGMGLPKPNLMQTNPKKGDYVKGKDEFLENSALPTAINAALEQAKKSGDFDGKDGYTPQKGVDYWTAADKQEIIDELGGAAGGGSSLPTGGTAGQVLTMGADGAYWADPPEGGGGGTLSVPSAQGVLF